MRRLCLLLTAALLGAAACGSDSKLSRLGAGAPSTPQPDGAPQGAVGDTLFRAVGNEPFWGVTVQRGRILFTRPGTPDLRFPAVDGLFGAGGDREWNTAADGHVLRLVAHATPCRDTMSDQAFTHTVEATVDGANFRGCGGGRTTAAAPSAAQSTPAPGAPSTPGSASTTPAAPAGSTP